MDIISLIKAATAIPKELKEKEKANKKVSEKSKTISGSSNRTINNNINITIYTIVDENIITNIKNVCKKDVSIVTEAARYLLLDLENNHGVIRLRSLYVINILFIRSNTFRTIVSKDIKHIAKCAGLLRIDGNYKLALTYQNEVESKVKELIELWDISYGGYYPQIRAMARYHHHYYYYYYYY